MTDTEPGSIGSRYSEEENGLIKSGKLDMSMDEYAKSSELKDQLLWLKLRKIHDDISDRAQITATTQRRIILVSMLVMFVALFPQLWLIVKTQATAETWIAAAGLIVAVCISAYYTLRPWWVDQKRRKRCLQSQEAEKLKEAEARMGSESMMAIVPRKWALGEKLPIFFVFTLVGVVIGFLIAIIENRNDSGITAGDYVLAIPTGLLAIGTLIAAIATLNTASYQKQLTQTNEMHINRELKRSRHQLLKERMELASAVLRPHAERDITESLEKGKWPEPEGSEIWKISWLLTYGKNGMNSEDMKTMLGLLHSLRESKFKPANEKEEFLTAFRSFQKQLVDLLPKWREEQLALSSELCDC